nr:hypothetical protein [Pseudomonas sp. BIGb0427]
MLVSMVSLTSVTAGVLSTASFEVATGGASDRHAQLIGVDVDIVAWGIDGDLAFCLPPLAMVMTSPLLRVTFISVPAGLVSVAV